MNKVATKALLRWAASTSPSLPDDVRSRLLAQNARRVNERGELVVSSQRFRNQAKNVADCLDKLRKLVLRAAKPPRPRKKTRPTAAARESRLREKKATAEKKRRRRPPSEQ